MSFTAYHYTRKTWEKEVFELLFDTPYLYAFALPNDHWQPDDQLSQHVQRRQRAVYEPRAGSRTEDSLLKRLVFVIYASEKDQYQKNMTEIQECISQVLKVIESAYLYAMLFFLLRISGLHMVSLWPTILSESTMILMQIKQELRLAFSEPLQNSY